MGANATGSNRIAQRRSTREIPLQARTWSCWTPMFGAPSTMGKRSTTPCVSSLKWQKLGIGQRGVPGTAQLPCRKSEAINTVTTIKNKPNYHPQNSLQPNQLSPTPLFPPPPPHTKIAMTLPTQNPAHTHPLRHLPTAPPLPHPSQTYMRTQFPAPNSNKTRHTPQTNWLRTP